MMTRVFPESISSDDVSALLAELATNEPYTDDNWSTASLDFSLFDLGINIKLQDQTFGRRHRERIATVIKILPELQSCISDSVDGKKGNDDHGLAWIDVDVDGDRIVDLCFNGISYNTQWNARFEVAHDGSWGR